jgi:transcriptional regulator with XRE-family HTH domain
MSTKSDQRRRRSHKEVPPLEFDPAGLARVLIGTRRQQELSTRDVARRSGVSQAYVVALERARAANLAPGPTPTVDVLTKLAYALGIPADLLFRKSTRPKSQHVLLIADEPDGELMVSIAHATGTNVGTWLTTSPNNPVDNKVRTLPIQLHAPVDRRSRAYHYDSVRVERKLRSELLRHGTSLDATHIGLVFDEMSTVMAALDDPNVVLDEEHRWADKVNAATARVGAHAVWNVCVYSLDALRSLPDPVEATNGLIESHDQVWHLRGKRLSKQHGALRRLAAQGLVNAS